MKSMFEAACVEEVKQRLEALKPNQPRQWGKMNPAQMLAHCSLGLEMAAGEIRPPRALMGRILGPVIKPRMRPISARGGRIFSRGHLETQRAMRQHLRWVHFAPLPHYELGGFSASSRCFTSSTHAAQTCFSLGITPDRGDLEVVSSDSQNWLHPLPERRRNFPQGLKPQCSCGFHRAQPAALRAGTPVVPFKAAKNNRRSFGRRSDLG